MSDTFDAAAHAAATEQAIASPEPSAPQADNTAENPAEITEDSAPSDEPTDAAPEDARETPSRAEKRIQQLLAERNAERARREALEAFVQQQRPQQPQPQEQAPAAPPSLPPDLAQWVGEEPKPDAFPAGEFDPAYLRAVARHEARNEQAQLMAQQRVYALRQAEEARARSFFEQAAKAEEKFSDFREVVGSFGQTLPAQHANLIAEAGPEVAYAIAKDADAAARIRAARNPVAVAREIGRIEARLERARETPPPQPTAAPEPPARIARGGNSGARDPSRMSMSEYAEWSRKQAPWARSG